jgi:hypothetical protein
LEQGKPTGIKWQDLSSRRGVKFEGERGWVITYRSDHDSSLDLLELGFGDWHLRLYGYFDGDEFMEVSREDLD